MFPDLTRHDMRFESSEACQMSDFLPLMQRLISLHVFCRPSKGPVQSDEQSMCSAWFWIPCSEATVDKASNYTPFQLNMTVRVAMVWFFTGCGVVLHWVHSTCLLDARSPLRLNPNLPIAFALVLSG